jgi:hypothetical protein
VLFSRSFDSSSPTKNRLKPEPQRNHVRVRAA